jgi:hypothetical protein
MSVRVSMPYALGSRYRMARPSRASQSGNLSACPNRCSGRWNFQSIWHEPRPTSGDACRLDDRNKTRRYHDEQLCNFHASPELLAKQHSSALRGLHRISRSEPRPLGDLPHIPDQPKRPPTRHTRSSHMGQARIRLCQSRHTRWRRCLWRIYGAKNTLSLR